MTSERKIASAVVWFIMGAAAWALLTDLAHASDDRYAGLHVTIPFTLDAAGVQVILRHDSVEARAGADTRKAYQLGVGLGVGSSVVGSAGMGYTSHHRTVVPYAGIRADHGGDWEAGAVTYGATKETTFLFAGARFNDDNHRGGDSNGRGNRTDGSPDGSGDDAAGNGDGGAGGRDDGNADDGDGGSGSGSGDQTNRSGLGDGTNPGRGSGRGNSNNTGSNNPGGGN